MITKIIQCKGQNKYTFLLYLKIRTCLNSFPRVCCTEFSCKLIGFVQKSKRFHSRSRCFYKFISFQFATTFFNNFIAYNTKGVPQGSCLDSLLFPMNELKTGLVLTFFFNVMERLTYQMLFEFKYRCEIIFWLLVTDYAVIDNNFRKILHFSFQGTFEM